MVSLTPAMAHQPHQPDPKRACRDCRRRHPRRDQPWRNCLRKRSGNRRRGKPSDDEGSLTTDDHQSGAGGDGNTERGEDERRRPEKRVLPGQEGTEATPPDERKELARGLPEDEQKEREEGCRDEQREGGDEDLDAAAEPQAKAAPGKPARGCHSVTMTHPIVSHRRSVRLRGRSAIDGHH